MSSSQDTYHHDRGGFSSGLFFGVIIGAAAGYFLSTEKGKEMLATLQETAGEAIDDLGDNEQVQQVVEQAKEALAHAKENTQAAVEQANEQIDQAQAAVHEAAAKVAAAEPSTPPAPKPRLFHRAGSPLKP